MKKDLLIVTALLLWSAASSAADKIEAIEISKAALHYENSKYYSDKIPVHFEGLESLLDVKDIVESKSFKLRTSARAQKDKDDSALELKLKIRGVCNYVFSSVVAKMQSYAEQINADAVINIRSDYAGNTVSRPGTYECIRGAMLSAVELKADFVKFNP